MKGIPGTLVQGVYLAGEDTTVQKPTVIRANQTGILALRENYEAVVAGSGKAYTSLDVATDGSAVFGGRDVTDDIYGVVTAAGVFTGVHPSTTSTKLVA